MNKPDCENFREWIALDLGEELPAREREDLTDHLGTCAACREERKAAEALGGLLHRSRIEVRQDFRSDVLAALPATGWESRAPRSWMLPLAAMILLASGATFLLSSGSVAMPSGLSALAAVGEMVRASILAGVGLLDASWMGMGFLVARVISSPVGFGAFGLFVLSVNLLVVSMIRKRRGVQTASDSFVRAGRR